MGKVGRTGTVVSVADYGPRGPWFETWPRHSLLWPWASHSYPLLSTGNPGSRERTTRTNCDEAGDYDVPNVLSPRDLVSRPDNMDETVLSSLMGKHQT